MLVIAHLEHGLARLRGEVDDEGKQRLGLVELGDNGVEARLGDFGGDVLMG